MKCWAYFNSTLETFHTNQSFSEVNLDVFEVAPAMSQGREDLDGTTCATTSAVSFSLVFTHAESPQMKAMI